MSQTEYWLPLHLLIWWLRWIAGKIFDILGNEDDVVVELCFNLLEGSRFVWHQSSPVRAFTKAVYSARYQGLANSAHRLSRQRHCEILQRALAFMLERSEQPARGAKGIAGG